jgi:vitamin B12 transporter
MKLMTPQKRLLATCALLSANAAYALPVLAQTTPTKSAETIVVTATRSAQPLSKVGASISIIDAKAISQSQATSVVDVLRDMPGLGISRNGGVGSLTSVRVRGAESDQTVLLLDGIKLNDPSGPGGGYNFGNLLVGDIARIEVLRGPQSTLYGSQAIGGVINIITRSGDVPFAASGEAETGGLSSNRIRGSVRGKSGALDYAFAASHFETDGISAAASGKEADSFINDGAQGRLSFALGDNLELEARAIWSKSDVGIDGFPPPTYAFSDTVERSKTEELIVYGGALLRSLDGRLQTRLGLSQTTTDRINSDPTLTTPTTFIATGTNKRLDLQSTFDLTPFVQIIAGGELEEASLKTASPSGFNPNPLPLRATTQLGALYVQGQASPTSWLTATLGARWSDNDRFGRALNTRATLAASFNEGHTIVRAGIADGFKAPTPFQLFSAFGTVTLKPEEASSIEFGVEQAFFNRRLIGAITAFERETTNQIDFISCFGNPLALCFNRPFGTYDNVAKAKANGLELTLEAKPNEHFSLTAGYSTLDARNRVQGSANFNRQLPRRAKVTGFVTAAYSFGFGLDVSATYSRTGASFNNASNTVRLAGYDLIGIRVSQKIGDHWSVFARVENASDEDYQTAAGYGSPPRQTFVGLRANF